MREQPPQFSEEQESMAIGKSSLVGRARQFASICDIAASFLLLGAAALFLLLLALGLNGQTEWPHAPLVILLFVLTLGVGFTTFLLARVTSLGLGWIGIIAGLILANIPIILALIGSHAGFTLNNTLLMGISKSVPGLGIYLITISVIHLMVANVYFITHSRQLVAEQFRQHRGGDIAQGSKKVEVSFIPHCWEMYACPDAARSKCPNFIDKINCWQRRRGCLCDHKLSTYLFQGPATSSAFQLANPQRVDLAQFSDLESYPARLREAKPRPWRERRPFCHNCAVFMEHQGYKYKKLNWVFMPISLIVVLFLYPYFHMAYNLGAHAMDTLARHLTASGSLPSGFYSDASSLIDSPYEYLLLAVLSMLLMSYVVEFTDWCLLDWKV